MTRLELTWPNKDRFLLVSKDDKGKPVWVDRDHPAAAEVRVSEFSAAIGDVSGSDPYGDNLLFTGDSLDVLRILTTVPEYARRYRGKVRLVYIDPPFNTGQAFEHYDDWLEHATWLSFMRERLKAIQGLLAPNGTVWVHLDDVEQHRMRVLLDEVFGADNFVGTVVWERADTVRNDARRFSTGHDLIHIYGMKGSEWSANRLPRTPENNGAYRNPDNDPRGVWLPVPLQAPGIRPNSTYAVVSPLTGKVHMPPAGKCWRRQPEEIEALVADNRLYFGKDGNGVPQLKNFLTDASDLVPDTVWSVKEVGGNRQSKAEMKALFPGAEPFATPKPERLLQRIIHIGTDPGDIVLDCFAGSGTTAAVAHKMGRRWVTAEVLPETAAAFTRPRLELVVRSEDRGGVTNAVAWQGGGGFRCVEVGPSMYVDTPFGVLLSDEATNGTFARAVAGQLGYEFQGNAAPLCGVQGKMRLAVLDGSVGDEEVVAAVAALDEGESIEIVGRSVLDGAAATLSSIAKGSKITKAPRDLLTAARRIRRRADREVGE